METIQTDYLVIGSWVAGLRAAIELSRHGRVIVITKDETHESCTEYAQGGVAVALSDEDEVGIHLTDTLKAGDGLCRQEAVKVLVEEGPLRITELIEWGARFDREGTKLSFTKEAAHSKKRILHAGGDSTGKEIERVLIANVKSLNNVVRCQFSTAIDLIVVDGVCIGARALDADGPMNIYAKATLLATGGAGQVYTCTTNPDVATGDGIALAYRAGAVLEDMEFIQFHPTALYLPGMPHFLLSEAMRGEGALLKDINGDLFMNKYHKDAELAPRDVVSRAIHSRIAATNASNVFLDLTHLDADFVRKRFPHIYDTCLRYSLDITRRPIPVSPAAHYIMGGVKTDLDGRTSIPGLFAAGEVACTGVHGANRLASNSLLEGLVIGCRAAAKAAALGANAAGVRAPSKKEHAPLFSPDPSLNIPDLKKSIRESMWNHVGIIRCAKSLKSAGQGFKELKALLDINFDSRAGVELRNVLTVATAITEAALFREGSIGAHCRSDFPSRGENWQLRTNTIKTGNGVNTTWL